jgi:hypothetical protein
MSEIIQNAKSAILQWNAARMNGQEASIMFSEGAYFEITKDNYQTWQNTINNPDTDSIHAYIGTEGSTINEQICFYLVDSVTDSLEVDNHTTQYDDNLKYVNYQPAKLENVYFNQQTFNNSDLNPIVAFQRLTQWTLHQNQWFINQQAEGAPQILVIPFKDLQNLFEDGAEVLICQPALASEGGNGQAPYQMDLIIWGQTQNDGLMGKTPQDLIQPVPPYSVYPESDFQLLMYAL